MPDEPRIGGTFRIQSKRTGKWLALPPAPGTGPFVPTGVWEHSHIVPRDQGAVWQIEEAFTDPQGAVFRFTTRSAFPWFDELFAQGEDPNVGRLDSNHDRQVYAHTKNDSQFQMWYPQRMGDGYWRLHNVATGLALDGDNDDIYTQRPNEGDYQRWGFFRASPEDWPV